MAGDEKELYDGGAANYLQSVQPAFSTGVNYQLVTVITGPVPTRKSMLELANRLEQKADSLLDALGRWDDITPSIKRTRDNAQILRVSLEDSPEELDQIPFRPLLEQLTLAAEAVERVPSIPHPPSITGPIFSTTASGTAFYGVDYANFAMGSFPDNPSVCDWGVKTGLRFGARYDEDNRRQDTRKRLSYPQNWANYMTVRLIQLLGTRQG